MLVVLIAGFGQTGPYAKRGGFDNIAIAIGGLMHITGPEVCRSVCLGIGGHYYALGGSTVLGKALQSLTARVGF